jgi:hypothetical protein
MVLIKQLTQQNWKNYIGLPCDILVREGGSKVWPRKVHRDIGIVVKKGQQVYIKWQGGGFTDCFNSVGEMIEQASEVFSFYYIEFK